MPRYKPLALLPIMGLASLTFACTEGAPEQCSGRDSVYAGSISARDDLPSLECVKVVIGDLTIVGTSGFSLSALSSLMQVEGDLVIESNAGLTSLKGLEALERVSGSLSISNNGKLANLDALAMLTEVQGDLKILHNAKLSSLKGLDSLRTIGGDLELSQLSALQTFEMPERLETLAGRLTVSRNDALETMTWGPFTPIESVAVERNPKLRSLHVPTIATEDSLSCFLKNDVWIIENDALTKVEFRAAARESFGCVGVFNNAALATIEAAATRFNRLEIFDAPKLISLDLEAAILRELSLHETGLITLRLPLTEVTCDLVVESNPQLASLEVDERAFGLDIHERLTFYDNPKLPACAAQALAASLAPATPRVCLGPGMRAPSDERSVAIEGNDDQATCR
jgi:hypothetical protein